MIISEDIKTIAEHYGLPHQLDKLTEECGELIVEIMKYKNGSGDKGNLIGEMADVLIMLGEITELLDAEESVNKWMEYKIARQIGRMHNE